MGRGRGLRQGPAVAMEPSFWSWEKLDSALRLEHPRQRRNGAQLLELGKGYQSHTCWLSVVMSQWSPAFGAGKRLIRCIGTVESDMSQWSPAFGAGKSFGLDHAKLLIYFCRNGAQLLELGKATIDYIRSILKERSQWSPAFGAGKSSCGDVGGDGGGVVAMEPSFWSWEKSSRFFHQLTTSVAHLCEQRKFWGTRVGLLLPDGLGKLALTRARALPMGTEGAGALARRSAGLGWVAPRGLQRI